MGHRCNRKTVIEINAQNLPRLRNVWNFTLAQGQKITSPCVCEHQDLFEQHRIHRILDLKDVGSGNGGGIVVVPYDIVRSVSVHDHLGQFVADASHDELVRQEGFVANLKIKCRNINIIVFRFRDLGTRRRIKGQTHFEDNVMENVHVVQLRSERFQIREHFRVVHLRDLVQGSVRKDLENGEIPALRIASHRRAAKHSRKSGN